jgi:hypothetical protein
VQFPRSTSSVGAGTSTKTGSPSVLRRYVPSSTRPRKLMLKLAAEPKRWISVTAPLSASATDDQLVDATVAL